MTYTFDYDTYSDLHKDAYGFRPRHSRFYDEATTDDERQELWDMAIVSANERFEREIEEERLALAEFEQTVKKTIEVGAGDEETALRWMVQGEDFYSGQDVEHWVWERGILFTDYGRKLVERLLDMIEFKEFRY
jgi:hypothetical protein